MRRLSIVLADDHAILREGLDALISQQDDMNIVAHAEDGAQAIVACRIHTPDVVVLDLTMPGTNGLKVIPTILEVSRDTKILVLSMHDRDSFLQSALSAGATGYVIKAFASRDILQAIRAVHKGQRFIRMTDSQAPTRLGNAHTPLRGTPQTKLSKREAQVLKLIAEGFTNQEAAESLGVGKKSIDSYRSRLQQKLGLFRRSELVRYALDTGILVPSVERE